MEEKTAPDADPASAIAEQFYTLLRDELFRIGHPKLFTIHEWKDTPGEVRDALRAVFARLIAEAREQRERWTRELIESEIEWLRKEIESGRFLTLDDPFQSFPRLDEILRPEDWPKVHGSPSDVRATVVGRAAAPGRNEEAARHLRVMTAALEKRSAELRREAENSPDLPRSLLLGFSSSCSAYAKEIEAIISTTGIGGSEEDDG